MKVYCVNYSNYAGKWIYNGYKAAWQSMGFDVNGLHQLKDEEEDYYLMITDSWVTKDRIRFLQKAKKVFLFVQPNVFPSPWGLHPNFVSQADDYIIEEINALENVKLWTFVDVREEFYFKWKKSINTVPLAFDNINYIPNRNENFSKFDVSFVGGWADNGFDEKRKIMIKTFQHFKESNLKCGFFVNKNLTHQQECDLLANSKVCINIHDAYQRSLGLDTNERTFKSLGLNGLLVSDTVQQLNTLFPDVPTSLETKKIISDIKRFLSLTDEEAYVIRNNNKINILNNHTYQKRIETLLTL